MCSDKSRLWSWACAGLRLTVGTMFLLFGVYDVIWPDAATSGTTVDLRYVDRAHKILCYRDSPHKICFLSLSLSLSTDPPSQHPNNTRTGQRLRR
jgi:hypothetical protein